MEKLKATLLSLHYPGVHKMTTDKEIGELLNVHNRQYFLTWVFEKLYSGKNLWSGDPDRKCHKLADLLYANGFCSSSNKLKFVKGDDSFGEDMQLIVFNKILNTVECASKEETSLLSKTIDLDDFISYINMSVDIFPNSGQPTQYMKDHDVKLAQYQKQFESLTMEIAILESIEKLNVDYNISEEEVVLRQIDRLENETIRFKELTCMMQDESVPATKFEVDDDILKMISSTSNATSKLAQNIENLQMISTFTESLSTMSVHNYLSTNKFIERLVKLSEEIAKY